MLQVKQLKNIFELLICQSLQHNLKKKYSIVQAQLNVIRTWDSISFLPELIHFLLGRKIYNVSQAFLDLWLKNKLHNNLHL